MVGGRLYLSFLKPLLPDLLIALPTLTLGSSPALLNSERGAQVLGSPLPHCVPVSMRGLGGWCCSRPNDHVQGVGCRKGAWFDSRFLWKQPGAGPHHLPHAPSRDDSDGALGGCFLLAEAGLVSPHLAMSSVCLFLGRSCC